MKQAVLSQFDLPWIPVTGLILFVTCFAAYTYWTYKKENKSTYDAASLIPLEEPSLASSSKGGN
jgi:cbb3-type cytochrome oxidase subunit 3